MIAALWTEGLKVRRSRMLLLTIAACTMVILLQGFYLFVLRNPEFARSAGLISAKVTLLGEATWSSYFSTLGDIVAAGGLVLFSFVISWVFGREYADRTAKDLLALPTSRATIVIAKAVVAALWCGLLAVLMTALGLLVGGVIGLSGWSSDMAVQNVAALGIGALLAVLVCAPIAWIASFSRGYLAAVGFAVLMVICAQVVAALGFAAYFPWTIPAIYTLSIVSGATPPDAISYMIVLATAAFGLIATLLWWHFADQT